MSWKTLDDMDLGGKRVLVRVDINVPVEDGEVTDDTRMQRIRPTIDAICDAGGKAILLAHFGRPKGKRVDGMSLRPLVPALERALGRQVMFCADNRGAAAQAAVAALAEGGVLLLENTRFEPGEEKNDTDLARDFAALGDLYCNDAFSAAHRAHASTEGVAQLLPACAGRLMQAELAALDAALGTPARPVMAVVGGAKVSTKLDLLGNLLEKVDILAIGGGMANTFLAAQGIAVGSSLCEHDMAETAREILAKAERMNTRILLPRDIVVAAEFRENAPSEVLDVAACPSDRMILDAGPESVAALVAAMKEARTLVWNGPLGAFEIAPFDAATNAAAQEAARLSAAGKLTSVAGGGDTVAALNHAGAADGFSYISTAGGAFLEWMEGKDLPGVAALMR